MWKSAHRVNWEVIVIIYSSAILACLAAALPIVDRGVFVITGVKTCRKRQGYCVLGFNCSADPEFVPDDEGGHCDGLRNAFKPSVHFSCCQYIPISNDTASTTTSQPESSTVPQGTTSSVTSTHAATSRITTTSSKLSPTTPAASLPTVKPAVLQDSNAKTAVKHDSQAVSQKESASKIESAEKRPVADDDSSSEEDDEEVSAESTEDRGKNKVKNNAQESQEVSKEQDSVAKPIESDEDSAEGSESEEDDSGDSDASDEDEISVGVSKGKNPHELHNETSDEDDSSNEEEEVTPPSTKEPEIQKQTVLPSTTPSLSPLHSASTPQIAQLTPNQSVVILEESTATETYVKEHITVQLGSLQIVLSDESLDALEKLSNSKTSPSPPLDKQTSHYTSTSTTPVAKTDPVSDKEVVNIPETTTIPSEIEETTTDSPGHPTTAVMESNDISDEEALYDDIVQVKEDDKSEEQTTTEASVSATEPQIAHDETPDLDTVTEEDIIIFEKSDSVTDEQIPISENTATESSTNAEMSERSEPDPVTESQTPVSEKFGTTFETNELSSDEDIATTEEVLAVSKDTTASTATIDSENGTPSNVTAELESTSPPPTSEKSSSTTVNVKEVTTDNQDILMEAITADPLDNILLPSTCGRRGSPFSNNNRDPLQRFDEGDEKISSTSIWCWIAAFVEVDSEPGGRISRSTYLCAGALVETDLVITTASCIERLFSRRLDQVRAVFGNSNVRLHVPQSAQYHPIKETVVHEDYQISATLHSNDIGLVKLQEPVQLSNTVCMLCLPPATRAEDAAPQSCTVVGYSHPEDVNAFGFTRSDESEADGSLSGLLHEAEQTVQTRSECRQRLRSYVVNETVASQAVDEFLCAQGREGTETCFVPDDRGSPMACWKNGYYQLTGLFSYGFHCTSPQLPSVYVDVSRHVPWIKLNYLRMLGFVV